jgi:fatty-acyl-CoA synthase
MKLMQDYFYDAAQKHGSSVAFDSLDRETTFTDFYKRTVHLAGALRNLGIKKGDRVAILAENCSDYIAYHYATAMLGAILLVLNVRHTPGELVWAVNNAEATALIIDGKNKKTLSGLVSSCQSINLKIGIDPITEVDYSTDELADQHLEIKDPPALSDEDPVLLIYTSGTTGRPKGALQTHAGSTMVDLLTAELLEVSPDDVYLAFMPYFHQAGLIRTRMTMIRGGKNVIVGRMDPESMVSHLINKKISITMLVPPFDLELTKIANRDNITFPSLRFIIGNGGAGPAHAQRMKAFCEEFNCRYMGIYGQTEVTGPATIIFDKDYWERPYSCGKPMRGIDLQIWDENNTPLPPNEVGEIMFRGKNCVPGYWRNDQGTRELYTGKWLHTGDLGKLDKEGFLYFVDRKKELIKTGGENVYPKEVENILIHHPAIADLAIIGLPDMDGWGELVTAVIIPKKGQTLTHEELKEYCRGKIAGYKIPKAVKLVDDIPRTFIGRVKKYELQERLKQG